MKTVEIDDKHAELLNEFADLNTAVKTAVQRFLIEQIGDKILSLSENNKRFSEKYGMNFSDFSERVSSDEEFILKLEQEEQIMTWEADLLDWEFCKKSMEDWKQKLEHILTE